MLDFLSLQSEHHSTLLTYLALCIDRSQAVGVVAVEKINKANNIFISQRRLWRLVIISWSRK